MNGISENYQLLKPEDVVAFAEQFENAWQDPQIPQRQWDLVVSKEIEAYRQGKPILPYDVLVECLRELPALEGATLCDVGAASGYYSEVLKIAGLNFNYSGVDSSWEFCKMAEKKFGVMVYHADAACLPTGNRGFDVILHSAVLMHCYEYWKAIKEAARAARRYVIFHRTAIVEGRATEHWVKDAYGVPVMEIHLSHDELMGIFAEHGLKVMRQRDLFFDGKTRSGHRTYVCSKES